MRRPATAKTLSLGLALGILVAATGAQAANPMAGRDVFDANCASCHGTDGTPVIPGVPNFKFRERLNKPDSQLMATMQNGLNVMPAWRGILSNQEMADALAYIRMLAR